MGDCDEKQEPPALDGDELNLVDRGLTEVPLAVAREFGSRTKTLNLSENSLTSGANLEYFTALETLVLDKNGLSTLIGFPKLPTVHTLWCNNNSVTDLVSFLDLVTTLFPKLRVFSLMRNPAGAPILCESEADAAAITRFRLYVVYRIPGLQFLDWSPVSADERKQAAAKGQYLAVVRPRQASSSSPTATAAKPDDTSAATLTVRTGAAADTASRKPAAFLGLGTSSYDGRHSEGNRFIVNDDL